MPHAWHSLVRWLGSRIAWLPAEPARTRTAILRAFADRSSIDWAAALRHVNGDRDRALIDSLHRLQALRGSAPRERTAEIRVWPLAIATALALAQIISVLVVAAVALPAGSASAAGVPLALALAFAGASLLLAAAAIRDDRAFLLLATFMLTASAFARAVITVTQADHPLLSTPLFLGVHPEVFASAALWELAVVFPAVQRFTTIDLLARRAAVCAWIVAAGLCAANVLLAVAPDVLPVTSFRRDDRGNLYWRVFAAIALPAIVTILVRAHRATRVERAKVIRFALTIAVGTGPFLILGVARSLPAVDGWARSPAARAWMDPLVLIPLGVLPVLTSVAVLVDRPFGSAPRTGERRWSVPLVSVVARRLRRRGVRDRLSDALDRLRLCRGARELSAVLVREIRSAVGSTTVGVDERGMLPAGTSLLPLLAETAGPLDLPREDEPFVLLPRADREWLDARGADLVAPIRLRDDTIAAVILVGRSPGTDPFDRTDRWFIGALASAAGAAWPASDERLVGEEPADECGRCGAVRAQGERSCCPDAPTRLASLPLQLAGKYTVVRRLGAGSMGVVYLGRDEALDREVALKTLPGLREGAVPQLRAEARAMAALDHSAIARIHGVETWRGTPVLVLEHVPGGTLADRLAQGRLPVDEGLRLGVRLADALAHVHGRGVLHRDVKPSNIGFAADGSVRLLDFGLAGAAEQTAGTRGYLPPEVLAGAPADAHVDLWGLAATLHEACAPDDRLADFVERALAPRRSDRYRSGAEMAAALRRLLERDRES